jgi:hypothetical protein
MSTTTTTHRFKMKKFQFYTDLKLNNLFKTNEMMKRAYSVNNFTNRKRSEETVVLTSYAIKSEFDQEDNISNSDDDIDNHQFKFSYRLSGI